MIKENDDLRIDSEGRRKFLALVGATLGIMWIPPLAAAKPLSKSWTVGEIMDTFIRQVPGAPFPNTVDTLKAGSLDTIVTGVVTTMFPTIPVINKAIELGANFIIVHEPSYYSHTDDTSWLENNAVFNFKRDLLKKHNIAIWRNHDYVHSLAADGVREGVVAQLGWERLPRPTTPTIQVPPQSMLDLINHVKEKLGVKSLRYLGDLKQSCSKILLMPGAAGGRRQIEALSREKPDVLICGEVSEWETPEHVRDAISKGDKLGLIVIGHSASEEGGSAFMAEWIHKNIDGIKAHHVPSLNSLSMI